MVNRVLKLQGVENVRELGGYITEGGKETRWHKLLRSGDLSKLTDEDILVLKEYGLKIVVDFRSLSEQKAAPDVKIDGVRYVSLSIFPEDNALGAASPEALMQQIKEPDDGEKIMENLYDSFVSNEYSVNRYAEFFRLLLGNKEKKSTLLFHCTAGKDRTGFAAAMILKLLGVPETTLFQDYQLTNQHLGKMKKQIDQAFQENKLPEVYLQATDEILEANPTYLQTALTAVDTHFDSFENFVTEGLRLSKEDQKKFKELYQVK